MISFSCWHFFLLKISSSDEKLGNITAVKMAFQESFRFNCFKVNEMAVPQGVGEGWDGVGTGNRQ